MEQYIVFIVNKQTFAVDIGSIERIIETEELKKTPETSDYFLGVTQYNGEILPIIDLSKRLYNVAASQGLGTKVIVTNWNHRFLGLLVDEVVGVQNFEDKQFEEINKGMDISKRYMLGFIKEEKDIIIVLDTSKIFEGEQKEELILATD